MEELIPYREVHDLLEAHGWVLQRIVKVGDESRRIYLSRRPDVPAISFPVRDRFVWRAHVERIKEIIDRFGTQGAD